MSSAEILISLPVILSRIKFVVLFEYIDTRFKDPKKSDLLTFRIFGLFFGITEL